MRALLLGSTMPVVDGAGGDPYAKRADVPPPYQEAFDETRRALTREHYAPGHVALGTFDSLTFGVPLGFRCKLETSSCVGGCSDGSTAIVSWPPRRSALPEAQRCRRRNG